jgi:hypothetical protein
MKRLLFLVFILFCTKIFAQEISFSNQIVNSTDKNIIAIREQWKLYVKDCFTAYITQNEQLLNKYWNDIDIQNQYSSIVMYQTIDAPVALLGETVTYDISKLDDGFYRLKAMVLMEDSLSKGIAANFTLYATVKDNEVKFCSYFQKEKEKLKTYSTAHIDYYYPSDFSFDTNEARKAEKLFAKLLLDFKVDKDKKIIYIVANDLDLANRLIGFDYSTHSSPFKGAGYFQKKFNMLFSCQVAHLHELVHVVIESKYPNVPRLFDEGIATYLGGGGGGYDYTFHLNQLRETVANQKEVNFSNFEDWDKVLENGTNHFYTIGAIFIDYAYKTGGQEKVEFLLKSKDDFNTTLKKELGIDNADAFIKSYLKNE